MKTLLRIGLPIIITLFVLLALFSGILPTKINPTPQNASEIVYSEETKLAIAQYEAALASVSLARNNQSMAELALSNAQTEYKAAERAACMSQYLAAQAKWKDTPSYMETELTRLKESMTQAEKCSF